MDMFDCDKTTNVEYNGTTNVEYDYKDAKEKLNLFGDNKYQIHFDCKEPTNTKPNYENEGTTSMEYDYKDAKEKLNLVGDNKYQIQYEFALNPELYQPSGSCNFSRIKLSQRESEVIAVLELEPNPKPQPQSESYWSTSLKCILIAPIAVYVGYKFAQWYL